MKKIYFLCITLFFLFPQIAFSTDLGTISGVIYDQESNFLLSKIQVSIEELDITTMTDINGEFKFADIPAGQYTIETSSFYFKDISKIIYVQKRRNSKIVLHLNRDFNLFNRNQFILMGVVTDFDSGKPISGASVIVKYNSQGTKTNNKGQFILLLPQDISMVSVFIIKDQVYNENVDQIILDPGPVTRIDVRLKKEAPLVRKMFDSKYREFTNKFVSLIKSDILTNGTVQTVGPNAISVFASEDEIDKVEKMVENFDVPFKQIWLEVRIIYASKEKNGDSIIEDELKLVSEQLRSLFSFNKYELLDIAKLGVEENSHCMFRTAKGFSEVKINKVEFIDENGGLIKLKNIHLRSRVDNQILLETSVNIPNGDTLILGTSSTDDATDKALIAVVTARVK